MRKKYTVSLIAMTKFKTFPNIFLIATMGISKCPQVNCDFMRALLKVKFAHPEKFDLRPLKSLDFLSLRWNLGRKKFIYWCGTVDKHSQKKCFLRKPHCDLPFKNLKSMFFKTKIFEWSGQPRRALWVNKKFQKNIDF